MLLCYREGHSLIILESYMHKSSIRNNSFVSHANKNYSTKDYSTTHKKVTTITDMLSLHRVSVSPQNRSTRTKVTGEIN